MSLLISAGFLILVAVLPLVWAVAAFNRLVRLRNKLREAWSGIDVQLRRRRDLIPPLVETVKAYRDHERELLESVTRHRSEAASAAGTARTAAPAENALSNDLGRLLALAEAYPDLRSDAHFRELGAQLVAIENDLQYARRYYNGATRDLNNRIETFPSMLVARLAGFTPGDFFEIENASEKLPPQVRDLLADAGPPRPPAPNADSAR